ncbi:calmodulin-binding receptor-like cytoplasmic kinase 3 isoform X2 [Mangifera indica]|uniref:calmodulin-binding receptor-like cytoplasmic kinase 3 isoform X2 n=1 Tax=Mangifera indica TaxID=29780 RepID=UPI001CF93047|nr:calmodulin-binding receptor-like cytoplasmic kinase 3 isoform X2 [Mangifera indica]
MEMGQIILLRMAGALFSLLLFMQLLEIFSSGFATRSKDCGAGLIAYSNFNDVELFYINGNLVDKTSFCKALQFHYASHCVFEGFFGSDYCGLDLSAAELPYKSRRKILQKDKREPMKHGEQPSLPAERKSKPKSVSTPQKVGIAVAGIFLVCFAVICPCLFRRNKATAHTVLSKDLNSEDFVSSEMISAPEKIPPSPLRVPPSPSRFTMSPKLSRIGSIHLNMSQVIKATCNFSPSLQIGEGGFGTVFKAKLEDGQVVAIKRAKKEHFDKLRTEFSSEGGLLAKIDHRNLVKLLGFLDKENERLIITEFVPNGTLREHLDEKQVIHRDVKSSNILLTESMRAKVADFGFARLGPMDSDQTHISTKVRGTVGYLDPEYMKTYQLTPKSDVYSFGILLLEILTGRRPVELKKPVDERVTVRWAFKKFNEGTVFDMVDPLMNEVVDEEILQKMFGLAIQCAAPIRNDRPDMKLAGERLWAIRADYLKSAKKG